MTSSRDVAVVIPVRDGAAYLDEALASVFAQTLSPTEVVVVDDGSTDGSADVVVAALTRTKLPDGKTIESGNRWVVTATKEGEQWKISNLLQVI